MPAALVGLPLLLSNLQFASPVFVSQQAVQTADGSHYQADLQAQHNVMLSECALSEAEHAVQCAVQPAAEAVEL